MKALAWIVRMVVAAIYTGLFAGLAYAVQLGGFLFAYELATGTKGYASWLVSLGALLLAIPVYCAGAVLTGPPAYLFATRLGRATPVHAIVTGAVLSLTAGAVLFGLAREGAALFLAAPLPLAGALGGLVFRATVLSVLRPPPARSS